MRLSSHFTTFNQMSPLFLLFFLCRSQILPLSSAPRRLYTSIDWTLPQYYETRRVVQAEDRIVHFTKGNSGILVATFDVNLQKWVSSKEFSTWMVDAAGWYLPHYFGTIRLASIGENVYIYVRGMVESTLAVYNARTFELTPLPFYAYLLDAEGYGNPGYYDTVRMVASGSVLYISARDNTGIRLAGFNTLTSAWFMLPTLAQFLDDAVWTQAKYYKTFQTVAIASKLWFMFRGADGLYLFSFSLITQLWTYSSSPALLIFNDVDSWGLPCYYETFQMVATSTGFYISARGYAGFLTFFYDISTQLFQQNSLALFSDVLNWNLMIYYETIHVVACGDAIMAIGRGTLNLQMGRLETPAGLWSLRAIRTRFTDAEHWDLRYRYWGLVEVCIADTLYAIGRDGDYLVMERYSVSADLWSAGETITSRTCDVSCQVCASVSAIDCTYCHQNAHLSGNSPSSCACNSGYFPNTDAGNCFLCHPSCKECVNYLCTACSPNASFAALSQPSVCKCDTGFFPNPSENNCSQCSVTCFECLGAGNTQCTACKVYASLANGACVCAQRYYMDNPSGDCYQCDYTCKMCTGPLVTHCVDCFNQAHISIYNTCECDDEYFPSPDAVHCFPCPHLCGYCLSAQICVNCKSNAYLHQDICRCSDGYYENPHTTECQLCSEGCASCILTGCFRCISPLNLYHGVCVQVCPSDMLVVENTCVEAPPEPILSVFPNNTLELSFTKSLSRVIAASDIAIQVFDGYIIYNPTWNMSTLVVMTSYLIDLAFPVSTAPTNYSSVLLLFNDPSSLQDLQGRVISKSNLTASLNPFPAVSPSIPSLTKNSSASQEASTTVQGALTVSLASSLFTGSPTLLLSLFNQLQLVTYIPLINVKIPDSFGNTLLGLSVNGFSFNPLSFLYDSGKASAPPSFARSCGFDTSLFLLNSSSLILSFACVLFTFLPILLLSQLSNCPLFSYYFAHLAGKYHWGIPLSVWLQVYLDAGISGLLQFYDYSWAQYGAKENGVLAGGCLCLFFLTPAFLILFIIRNREKMLNRSDSDFNSRWGALYEEFRVASGLPSIAFYAYFILRRCVYGIVLICLHSYPTFQLFSSLTTSVLV